VKLVDVRFRARIPDDSEEFIPDVIEEVREIVKFLFRIKERMDSPVVISIESISEDAAQEGKVL
jgi:hypothetical protein